MITLKSPQEIERMRRAGAITAQARALAGQLIRPGVTTGEINREVDRFIRSQGATPSFLHVPGPGGPYPGSLCISIDEELIHGIPGERVLREGELVKCDVGACIDGYHGDCAATFPCGTVTPEARRLMEVTRESFFRGIAYAREGCRLYDISAAIQAYVEEHGFSVVRDYVGHGIGTRVHEPPEVPNFGRGGRGPRLLRGMTLAIEPMVQAGGSAVTLGGDGWTVRSADGSLAAHYENTVLITDADPEILTVPVI